MTAAKLTSAALAAWPDQHVDMATLAIPCTCTCTWIVISPGPGMACVSRLKARNNSCPHRHAAGKAAR